MKRQLVFTLFICLFAAYAISSTLIVGGCGDGGFLPPTPTPLGTGEFIKTVELANTSYWLNLFGANTETRYQMLLLAADIQGSGIINSVAFHYKYDEPSDVTCSNTTIKMGHTSVASLSNVYADSVELGQGSFMTVLDDAAVTLPAGLAGDYVEIALDEPFIYNGVDNLVVEVTRTAGCTDPVEMDAGPGTPTYTATVWAYSSTATSGVTSQALPNMQLVFAGGDNEQNFGGTSNDSFPFSDLTPRTQNLYLASEIDGSGPITGLAFQMNGVSTAQTYTSMVRMGHTTLAALGTNYADNYDAGAPVTVANTVTFSIPAGIPAGEWFWVPLPDSTFTYNGTDNLIVDVVTTAGSGGTPLRCTTIAGRRAYNVDNTNPVAANVDGYAYHIKLRFNGGTMDVMTSGSSLDVPFYGIDDTVLQVIYGANDLGTKAQIDKVAFRVIADSVADDYTGFSVVMGHTTNTTLSMTLADNMDDPTNVFSGTVNMPAGLKAGDWVEIPVSGFSYNPLKNLTIQVTANKGTGNNTNSIFAGSRAISGAGAASIGSPTFDLGVSPNSAALKLSYTKY